MLPTTVFELCLHYAIPDRFRMVLENNAISQKLRTILTYDELKDWLDDSKAHTYYQGLGLNQDERVIQWVIDHPTIPLIDELARNHHPLAVQWTMNLLQYERNHDILLPQLSSNTNEIVLGVLFKLFPNAIQLHELAQNKCPLASEYFIDHPDAFYQERWVCCQREDTIMVSHLINHPHLIDWSAIHKNKNPDMARYMLDQLSCQQKAQLPWFWNYIASLPYPDLISVAIEELNNTTDSEIHQRIIKGLSSNPHSRAVTFLFSHLAEEIDWNSWVMNPHTLAVMDVMSRISKRHPVFLRLMMLDPGFRNRIIYGISQHTHPDIHKWIIKGGIYQSMNGLPWFYPKDEYTWWHRTEHPTMLRWMWEHSGDDQDRFIHLPSCSFIKIPARLNVQEWLV